MPLRTRRVLLRLAVTVLAITGLTALGGPATADDPQPPLTNSQAPTIVGTGWSEDGLSVEVGEWSSEPDQVGARWYTDDGTVLAVCGVLCGNIQLSREEIGHQVYVTVHAQADCCTSYQETSEPITISGPHPVERPGIRGAGLHAGTTLHALPGRWTFPVDHFEYEWSRSASNGFHFEPVADTRDFTPRLRDLGRCLLVRVRAVGSDGHEGTARSGRACYVEANPRVALHVHRDSGGDRVAVLRVRFHHPRQTLDGRATVILSVDGERQLHRRVTSPRLRATFALQPGQHTVEAYAEAAGHTGRRSQSWEVQGVTVLDR